jgi:protein gp37
MENSNIEWTDHTFNPWWGCMKVSDGCKNCYAETLDNRYNHADPHWGPNSPRKPMSEAYWKQPYKWDTAAKAAGVKAKVFCASMADVFEDNNQVYGWRIDLFHVIINTPHLIWQVLTKRPENIAQLVPTEWMDRKWPSNLWIGTSVENQKAADERIPHLLKIPASIRFLSCEPLLDHLFITDYLGQLKAINDETNNELNTVGRGIQWVICGGESGHNARPMHVQWARNLRDQCINDNVPFFFKQWGEYAPDENHIPYNVDNLYRVGKKAAGSLLDGLSYKQFPQSKSNSITQ